jgi:hypothetical protein
MSSKKKSSAPVAIGPKYKIGQKVYVLIYHRGIPEELIEGTVECVTTSEYAVLSPLGKSSIVESSYAYTIKGFRVPVIEQEASVYPNYTEAAKVFAKAFLLLLK